MGGSRCIQDLISTSMILVAGCLRDDWGACKPAPRPLAVHAMLQATLQASLLSRKVIDTEKRKQTPNSFQKQKVPQCTAA
jgi:hypothetical protein